MNRISELESVTRRLEPDINERHEVAEKALKYIDRFIDLIPSSKAYAEGNCDLLRTQKVEESGKSFERLLELIRTEVNHIGINSASGANFAYIQSGGIWVSAIADMLAAAGNKYAGVYYSGPGAVIVENQMIQWLCSIVGYPSSAHGNLSSGGSVANLIAIQAARDAHGINSTNVKKSVIYFTEQTHHCIQKALHTTALGEAVHRIIPLNSNYQMNVEALQDVMVEDEKKSLRPFLVIATAGTTDAGAIDPLDKIADICSEHKAWYHIDAAYGGFFVLVDQFREKFKGIDHSDSLVLDPHKSMFLPFGIGAVLVRNGNLLLTSNSYGASYMQDSYGHEEISPADSGPELTKHFRGLRMWLPLHLYGVNVFRANLEEKILLCRHFHDEIGKMGFETGPFPELSITLFRFPAKDNNEFNKCFLDAIRKDGRCFFSSTMIDGEFWIRCAVLNFRTHLREIQFALDIIREKLGTMI